MAINLSKDQKVNLVKTVNTGLGEILINLNWNSKAVKKKGLAGLFGALESEAIDLDLGCLYELKDGSKGTVQAVGKHFGSQTDRPYISLDGDDRTGENAEGENLRINGNMISNIKRILVYTFIYEGIANWKQADGVVTIKYPGAEDIVIKMDEYDSTDKMCGLALFENIDDETFSVQRIVKFFNGHPALDKAYNWGLSWRPGKKD